VKERIETIIKYRLERAKESMGDAKQLFENGSLHSVVNRIYYAMFYSVIALLLTRHLSSKHSGVRALFNREFVNKGKLDKDSGRFYSEIFEKRQKGDYKDLVEFKREEVEIWLKKGEMFVKKIEKLTLKTMEEQK
jgi:uncharacterized protein (UPF0332 family)